MTKFPLKTLNTDKTRMRARDLGAVFPGGHIPFPWAYMIIDENGKGRLTSVYETYRDCPFPEIDPEEFCKKDKE